MILHVITLFIYNWNIIKANILLNRDCYEQGALMKTDAPDINLFAQRLHKLI